MDETEGRLVVELARHAVESEASGSEFKAEDFPENLQGKRGVFVTLNTYPQGELRGCIGFPMPVYPLPEAIIAAAGYACHDPRFPDLKASELGNITVEVSVLTLPEIIHGDAELRPQSIEVGKDGLIVESGNHKGLLLPQVAEEWGWNAKEFLEQTCVKAGISASSWKRKDVAVYKFQAEIFSEISPNGEVRRHENE